jgi:hypothetical protein
MKISHLQEGSLAGMPSPSQPAPKFGRSNVAIEETIVAGNVGGGAPTNMGMQRRGQGSMFQGIKTSKKFANTPVTEDDISEEHISAKQRREEFFNKSQSRDIGDRPQDKDILPKKTHESDGEYDDEAGMIKTNLHTALRAVKGLHKTISDGENCPEWVQEKIAVANDYLVTCWDYMISQHEQGRKYEMNEASLGDYRKKATMSKAKAQLDKRLGDNPKADVTIGSRTRGLQRAASRNEITRLAQLEKDTQHHRENLPNYKKQLVNLEKEYNAGGGDSWKHADRMMPNDIKLRDMHTQIQNLRRIIQNTQQGMNEGEVDEMLGFKIDNKLKVSKPSTSLSMMRKEFEKDKPNKPETVTRDQDSNKNVKYVKTIAAEQELDEKSVSKAQFRTMAAVAHNPKFAKKIGISPKVGKEFHKADKKQDYKKLPARSAVKEGPPTTQTPSTFDTITSTIGSMADKVATTIANNRPFDEKTYTKNTTQSSPRMTR